MAKVRNISGDAVQVPELGGFGGGRVVADQEVVDIPDDRYAGYVCQPDTWESVAEPVGDVTDPTIDPAPAPEPVAAGGETSVTPAGPPPATGAPAPPPLYLHAGAGDVDVAVWPPAHLQTPDGQPLYHFSGDTGSDATGASDDWHVYTGPTGPTTDGSDH